MPAKVRRALSPEESAAFIPHAARYVDIAQNQAPLGDALPLDEVLYD